eukprot:sb/3476740/
MASRFYKINFPCPPQVVPTALLETATFSQRRAGRKVSEITRHWQEFMHHIPVIRESYSMPCLFSQILQRVYTSGKQLWKPLRFFPRSAAQILLSDWLKFRALETSANQNLSKLV